MILDKHLQLLSDNTRYGLPSLCFKLCQKMKPCLRSKHEIRNEQRKKEGQNFAISWRFLYYHEKMENWWSFTEHDQDYWWSCTHQHPSWATMSSTYSETSWEATQTESKSIHSMLLRQRLHHFWIRLWH